MVRPRPRDGLHARDAVLRDRARVRAEDQPRGGRRERRETRDGQVLVVEGRVVEQDRGRLVGLSVCFMSEAGGSVRAPSSRRAAPTVCCRRLGTLRRRGSLFGGTHRLCTPPST